MKAFHHQAVMKHQIYENILARRSGMDYSPGIHFETSLFNMDEAKAITESNQPEKSNQKQQRQFRCGFIKHLFFARINLYCLLWCWMVWENCLGVTLLRTGRKGRGRYKGGTKGDMVA